ncbi:MAG: UDP-glucose--hexose-1-phosphate uridylyltransferase [Treponema sp.]|nr:UDP-glucose--hexose-1-phosphate uridylyltransferase [Treponema sp.]
MSEKIEDLILELTAYGKAAGLVAKEDEIYTINRLLELFRLDGLENQELPSSFRPIQTILDLMTSWAFKNDLLNCKDLTITQADLFDTKIMGLLTPPPSSVIKTFNEKKTESAENATNWYYNFSKATNYIRTERIKKDKKWITSTPFGDLDITINLSKPEKDPRDIAAAGKAKSGGYPKCLLCAENEGYQGHLTHPARQNHRIIPLTLCGEDYGLQYSPYVYYNEHCIIFNKAHTPMKIDSACFKKLISFVKQFPHYMAGSNADLPIVGGSILSHDHFQGGRYTFAMAKSPVEIPLKFSGFEDIQAGIVKWPMSVIRLNGKNEKSIVDLAEKILFTWRNYSDSDAFIFAETEGVPHNTITPIARMRDGNFELDLVLRNNITTPEHPMGLYHPWEELHHIKKENIGLIEVMGLAVLPSRLKKELEELAEAVLEEKDISKIENLSKHGPWIDEIKAKYKDINQNNIEKILEDETGLVFAKVLECAGVYKCTKEGREAFMRFAKTAGAL